MAKQINIILGIIDNQSCKNLIAMFEQQLGRFLDNEHELGIVAHTFNRDEFDAAVASGNYQACFVLEKMEDKPIGQGAIKKWRKDNPDIQIILMMDSVRKSSAKAKGLYDIEYYNGMFVSEVNLSALAKAVQYGRTAEEAYVYYGLKDYVEVEKTKKDEPAKVEKSKADPVIGETKELLTEPESQKVSEESNNVLESEPTVAEKEKDVSVADKVAVENNVTEDNKVEDNKAEDNEEDTGSTDKEPKFIEVAEKKVESAISIENVSVVADPKTDKVNVYDVIERLENPEVVEEKHKERVFTNDSDDKSRHKEKKVSFVNQETKGAYKSLKNIFQSDESVAEYFKNISGQVYKDKSNINKGEIDVPEGIFVATLERFMEQYEVVLDEAASGILSQDTIEDQVYDVIEGISGPSDQKEMAYKQFLRFVQGYDLLEELIDNDDITDIHVLDAEHIRVKKNGERCSTDLRFIGAHRYERLCRQLELRNRDRLNSEGLTLSYTDTEYSDKFFLHVSIVNKAINSYNVPELRIKKTAKKKLTLPELVEGGFLSMKEAAYLIRHIHTSDLGVLVIGSPGSGKTTFLNALVDYIPKNRSGIIIQFRDELLAGVHPEITVQHPLITAESKADIEALSDNALSSDADYYILGDVKGLEARSYYKALESNFISWTCVNSLTPYGAITKIVGCMGNVDKETRTECQNMITQKLGVIVVMKKNHVDKLYIVDSSSNDITERFIELSDSTIK